MLHPELQAELEFGINNSKQDSGEVTVDFSGLLKEFLGRTSEWKEAEGHIQELRRSKRRATDEFITSLRNSVAHEVEYLYCAWDGHWERARDSAKSAFEALDGEQLVGYQGWWMYLCGDAEVAGGDSGGERRGNEYFSQAARQCPSLSWLSRLAVGETTSRDRDQEPPSDLASAECVENLVGLVRKWGFHGRTFTERVNAGQALLEADPHTDFHQGLEFVGHILGWDTVRPTGDGEPDCVWALGHRLYIAFEAKSEQGVAGEIGKKDVQQALGHADWIRANQGPSENARIIPVLVTPRTKLASSAKPHASGLYAVSVDDMRSLGRQAVKTVGKVRNGIAAIDEIEALATARERLGAAELLPDSIADRLSADPLIKS